MKKFIKLFICFCIGILMYHSNFEIIELSAKYEKSFEELELNKLICSEASFQLENKTGDLKVEIYTGTCSKNELNIMIKWSWTKAPFVIGSNINDRISISWQGTNLQGEPLDLFDFGSTHAIVMYYQDNQYVSTVLNKPNEETRLDKISIPIKMKKDNAIAMKGILTTTLKNYNLDNIQEAAIVFEYGHSKFKVNHFKLGPIKIPYLCLDNQDSDIKLVKRITNKGDILD